MHIHPTQSIMFNWCSFHSYCLSLPSLIIIILHKSPHTIILHIILPCRIESPHIIIFPLYLSFGDAFSPLLRSFLLPYTIHYTLPPFKDGRSESYCFLLLPTPHQE